MSYEAKGTIHIIKPVQQVTEKFKKREFILKIDEEINGNVYSNYVPFQTVQAKTDLLDRYQVDEEVTVSFNLKGNLWKDGAIGNLDCWKIQSAASNTPAPQQAASQNMQSTPQTNSTELSGDLPF